MLILDGYRHIFKQVRPAGRSKKNGRLAAPVEYHFSFS